MSSSHSTRKKKMLSGRSTCSLSWTMFPWCCESVYEAKLIRAADQQDSGGFAHGLKE